MKIKIKKYAHIKEKEKIKKRRVKRIVLPRIIRLVVIGIIGLILLYSAVNVYAAYQKEEITTRAVPVLSYFQSGYFDYKVYLEKNSIYQDKEYLLPGEGIYFKNIVKNITASFTYSFNIDKTSEISGSYRLEAEIQTSVWTKNYSFTTEDASGNFQTNGKNAEFSIEPFVVDLDYYENIVSKIEGETGVTVTSPKLVIKCTISVIAKTTGKTIYKTFTPTLSFTLKTKQIEITESTTNYQSNVETNKQEDYHQEVVDERNRWTTISYILLFIFILITLITRSNKGKLNIIERNVKKINKKFGEWIVEIERQPQTAINSAIIFMKTLEDLMKISEELAKPVMHYKSLDNHHFYYVIDENLHYQFKI